MKNLIVYYDGDCGLCSRTVQFLKRNDKKKKFEYQTLQFAFPSVEHKSFIFREEDKHYFKSTAALKVVKHLGGIWPYLSIGVIIPRFLRDAVYDFVAKNRYKWFGKAKECEVSS